MKQDKYITLQQIPKRALTNSVVCIKTEREIPCLTLRPQLYLSKIISTQGSGFFIDKQLIVTNLHIIVGASSVTIGQSGQEDKLRIESVEAYDEENDLILLTVDCKEIPLTLGDSNIVHKGDEISAVGYSDDAFEIEEGFVRNNLRGSSEDLICLSTESSGVGSGSAILDSFGEVIGVMSSFGVDDYGNVIYGYATPSNIVKELHQNRTESVPFEEWCDLPQVRYLAEIDAAEKFLEDGDYNEAIAHYDIAIGLIPDKKNAIAGRAAVKFELAYFNEAMTDHISSLKLDFVPFRFSNLRESMSWRWRMLKLYGLRFFLNLFVSITGRRFWLRSSANANSRKAKRAMDEGKLWGVHSFCHNAISQFSEVIDLKEETDIIYNSRAWMRYVLGQFESEQGNTDKAVNCYQDALDDIDAAFKLEPKLPQVRSACFHTRGAAKAALGKHEAAIEDFNESIRINPKKALYYQDRALSKQALGQHEAAEEDFAKVKELDPDIED